MEYPGEKRRPRNVKANTTYGTKRMSAYHILEQTLNQRDVRVFDYIEDENGKKKPVLNKKETAIAQDRQELIKQKFAEWIWKDIDRRELLCRIYNETFNGVRPREYDGRHIRFEGMNPEISLRPHQINAIAHILYGGNTLLAHEVGAGKTYEMVGRCHGDEAFGPLHQVADRGAKPHHRAVGGGMAPALSQRQHFSCHEERF